MFDNITMGRKKATVATKSRIMKLASETRDYQVDEVTQEWLENEPKLNANSVNLFEDLCDATKQGTIILHKEKRAYDLD